MSERRRCEIIDSALRDWVDGHTEHWEGNLWASVAGYQESHWRTYREIITRFGSMWPKVGDVGGQAVVQRYMRSLPKVRRNDVAYDAPYSLELHLRALVVATDQRDNPYGEAEVIA